MTPHVETPIQADTMQQNVGRATDFLKALANQSRLMILCILSEGEHNVSEIEARLTLRQPTLSQQLARLREDGLVETRREDKTIIYSLASDEARAVVGLVHQLFCEE